MNRRRSRIARTIGNAISWLRDANGGSTVAVARGSVLPLLFLAALALMLTIVLPTTRAAGTFAPTVDFQLSTTRATSHPDARIVIDNSASDEDLKSVQIDLPDGLWGSLAAAEPCRYADAVVGACLPSSKIGDVVNDAVVDKSDVRLRGEVFLTEPCDVGACAGNADTDPAGISFKVPAKVGGVNLGDVIVNARVIARYGPAAGPGAFGPIEGIATIADDLPNQITDSHGRTVTFDLKRIMIDLRSDQASSFEPLLTNPSKCGQVAVSGSATSYDGSGVSIVDSDPETIDRCETTALTILSADMRALGSGATPAAGEEVGVETQLTFPEDSPSLRAVEVQLPPMLGPNFPAFGSSADQCPTAAAPSALASFVPSMCPPQAIVGTATITTPLLPDPLVGDVYLIEKSPIPWLGIDVSPGPAHPGNPAGVAIRLIGTTATPQVDPACDPLLDPNGYCQTRIVARFTNLPDAPIRSVHVLVNRDNRPGTGGPLGKILTVASPSDPVCQPWDDFTVRVHPNSTSGSVGESADVAGQEFVGCDARDVVFDVGAGSDVGKKTTDTTPTFIFTGGLGECKIDSAPAIPCASPFTPSSPLGIGVHRLTVTGLPSESRSFVVSAPGPSDSTAPQTALDSGPGEGGTTADTTPTWGFSADEPSRFQCSVDDGAFLPCGPATTGTAADFTLPAGEAFLPGRVHKFAVRAEDAAGNVDPSPAEVSFNVSVPFEPRLDVSLTTSAARAHPDADITIENLSEQDLEDVTIKMPDGFFGGLRGAQELCSVEQENAGSCPESSKIGTIETEAIVDESVVRLDGELYLTDRRTGGDPAGLMIKVPAKIQSVDLGDVLVRPRLRVRGQAQGLDTIAIGIPRDIDPSASGNSFDSVTAFTLRKLVIKLRTNPGATQPLLTNPSSCSPGEFRAEFEPYGGAPATSAVQLFAATACDAVGFAPRLTATIARPDGGPVDGQDAQPVDLHASLASNPDEAGIAGASVLMPKPLTIDILKLPPVICEDAGQPIELVDCPDASIIGDAVATSPLLRPGESLSGPVYLMRGRDANGNITALPRLLVKLGGRISVRIVGRTSFENGTQIRTVFSDLPDAPLSSFDLRVTNLLRTMKDPCGLVSQSGASMTGVLTGHNGKAADVNSVLPFACDVTSGLGVRHRLRRRGKSTTLGLGFKARGAHPPMSRIRLHFRDDIDLRRNAERHLTVRVNRRALGRGVVHRYVTVRGKSVLEFRIPGKSYGRVDFIFRKGSLVTYKGKPRTSVQYSVSDGLRANKISKRISLATPVRSYVVR